MTKITAMRIHAYGGPEEIRAEEMEIGAPGPGEVRMENHAVAVHFADTLLRAGAYYVKPPLPATLGLEAAGVVAEIGPGVEGFAPGDRVACPFLPGAAVNARNVPAASLIRLTDGVAAETSAAGLLRGMTVQYLVRQAYRVGPDDTVLVHAAAGGVGVLLCQWARALGARVIGTVGGPAKVAVAEAAGAQHVIDYAAGDFAERCAAIAGENGIDVVFDSVGADTFAGNIKVLRPTGYFINYGVSSGPLPPIDAMALNAKSLFFAKLSYPHYARTPEATAAMAAETLEMFENGTLKVDITARYPLTEVAQAHRDIAARKTTGSIVLIP